jgi:hypothetical protein
MKDEELKELKKWYKVYVLYKDTPYIGFLEEFYNKLYEQSYNVWMKLSKLKSNENYEKYFTLEDTIELSKKFLATIDDRYPNYLNEGLNNGAIDIYDKSDLYDLNRNMINGKEKGPYYVIEDIKHGDVINHFKTISLPLEHNLEDVYALIHELFHSINASAFYDSYDFRLLTESVSITYEFILYDYLKEQGICSEDRIKPIEFRIVDLCKKAGTLAKGLTIFKNIKENIDILKGTFTQVNKEEKKSLKDDYHTLRKTIEYYLGTLIAIINYKKYKEGKLDINTIEDYNYSLKKNDELESLDILFDRFPSIQEVNESIDFILNEINNSKIKIKK